MFGGVAPLHLVTPFHAVLVWACDTATNRSGFRWRPLAIARKLSRRRYCPGFIDVEAAIVSFRKFDGTVRSGAAAEGTTPEKFKRLPKRRSRRGGVQKLGYAQFARLVDGSP
jgi:hypothetical protein